MAQNLDRIWYIIFCDLLYLIETTASQLTLLTAVEIRTNLVGGAQD